VGTEFFKGFFNQVRKETKGEFPEESPGSLVCIDRLANAPLAICPCGEVIPAGFITTPAFK